MGVYNTILHDPALAAEMRRAQARTDYRTGRTDTTAKPKPKKTKPKKNKPKGKTTMPRRSNQELAELSERKWSDLTPGERKSVRAWMRRQHDDDTALDLETADLLEHNQHISIAKAYAITDAVNSHDDATEEPAQTEEPDEIAVETPAPAPAPAPEPAPEATPAYERPHALQALADGTSIQWLDEWPEDATLAHKTVGHWQQVAAALRKTGRPAIISENTTRKQAMGLARTINKGLSGTWSPKGAYRAALRDKTQVIAQYIGGAES